MSDNDELQQIAHLRREYTKGGLRRRDLPADPLTLFERWLSQACEAKQADPTAIGKAERLSTLEVMKYFHSRPRDSQIGAWVSKQSSRISARGILESKFLELKQKFQQGEVPLPSFWGGFRVSLEQIEFWQGGEHRLHDRFLYQRENDAWKIDRLAP